MEHEKLLNLLLKAGYIKESDIKKVLEERKEDEDIFQTLLRLGVLSEKEIMNFFQTILPQKVWKEEVEELHVPSHILNSIPQDFMRKFKVVPVLYEKGKLHVIMLNPLNQNLINELRFYTKANSIVPYVAPLSTIERILDKQFPQLGDVLSQIEDSEVEIEEEEEDTPIDQLLHATEEAPIVKLANGLIFEAVRMGASDIHIEPFEKKVLVRYRVDGVLKIYHQLPINIKDSLVARYKILSNLDIAEKRKPQDGRIRIKIDRKKIDLRVSTVPTVYGEKVVMRIQEAEKYLNVKLEDLGFEPDDLEKFRGAIWKPWGMILVTGPTGSGKTTTLYSALMERNEPDVNIMTAEDPVEVAIPGINQVQVNERIGLTFSSVLRAFLRQDPDIILVGEIRDQETGDIAVRASLTGHLVFSTLHTNDAPTTVTRLTDMGIEPFLVGSSLVLVVAQRLIRRLCPDCKVPHDVPKEALVRMGVLKSPDEDAVIYKASEKGCPTCNNTGYKGRMAVHEIMEIDDELRKLIIKGGTADDIRDLALQKGMRTLYQSGMLKVKKGITSIEEVNRVLMQ
ncbi:GspE/PulE family protein [Hydrogenivirga sp. 128-5-R1-1]|uniref:GspE/PulE family protein n=1 Tax=Hydrogenivirga sp. 128-5-R1-1 TaxID=392423 RepID=UPI00015F0D34|nr:GspE/PulE family protein [Hydrogenivirga sp. 128-5-R1-1]EDP75899.1 type IV pilus assembly protein TapB [Hydrogenivirga sp. 128-5-R1-1]